MKKNAQFINGLDIQKEYISIVQYSPDENSVVLVAIQPLVSGSVETMWSRTSSALLELKNKFKFNTPELVCSVPSEYAIIKKIPIDRDATHLDELLEWELGQHVIGSIEDYSIDFQDGGISGNSTQRELLAVAYRKDHLLEISTALKTLKLKPVVVDIDVFAVVNVFEVNYKELVSQPAIIVHAESEKTKLILTRDGLYIDTDMFSYEYGFFEAESYAEKLKSELDKMTRLNAPFLEKTPSLFLTGSLFGQQNFVDAAISRMGYGELLNPFRTVGCRVQTDENQIMAYASRLTVAIGLALRGND